MGHLWRYSFLIALVLWFTRAGRAGDVPRPAPPLTVNTPGGEKISIQDFRGKVLLLKFLSTDCKHCQRSAGNIMPIYREWRKRGLEVVGIAFNPDAAKLIPEFASRFGVTYPLAVGTTATFVAFADVPARTRLFVPHIFLIDRQGVIRYEHLAKDQAFYDNEAQNLRAELDALLKEPAPARKAARK